MDSSKKQSDTPSKNRFARTISKVMHNRAAAKGVAPDDGQRKKNKKSELVGPIDEQAVKEAFIAKLFANLSSIKAAYAQLQLAQSPYDPDGIQFADDLIILELHSLSEMKQCYFKNQIDDSSPEKTKLLAEILEQKNLVKTYEITGKKLESQTKLKDSEIIFLTEKLEEANKDNKLLEKRLNLSGSASLLENLQLTSQNPSLNPSQFVTFIQQTVKLIRRFARLFSTEIENAGWDLNSVVNSILPGAIFWKPSHRSFAFESFVCREMFDGFNYPFFEASQEKKKNQRFLHRFIEMNPVKANDYLAWKPKSSFARFYRDKYARVIHPKLEATIITENLNQKFAEMAKRVWLLHCLAFSFDPEASIFQVRNGSRFSEVYMESVNDEAFIIPSNGSVESDPQVGFMVVPGFMVRKMVVQCQVYLR